MRTLCVTVLLAVFAVYDGYADTCEPGQYMVCNLDSQYGTSCDDCGCASCDPGYTSDGTGYVSYCPNEYGSTGCYLIGDLCPGYDDTCPASVGSGKKCKEVSGCPSPCQKYDVCNTSNGEISQYTDGSCHMEGNTCYANQRNCSLFGDNNLAPVEGTQYSGVAKWVANGNGYKWDVGGCTSSAENQESDIANCKSLTFYGRVHSQNRYIANVQSKITYTTERAYCSKCKPGAVLTLMDSPTGGVYYRPADVSGNWGGAFCWEQVQAPNYADGCVIDFSKPNGNDAINAPGCTKSCPVGYATQEDGATSEADCEFDTSAVFHDATGDFTLGNMTTCPTNGG